MEKIEHNAEITNPDDLLPFFDHENEGVQPEASPEAQATSDSRPTKIIGLSELAKKPVKLTNPVREDRQSPIVETISNKQTEQGVKTLHKVNAEEQPRRLGKTLADELSRRKKVDISFGESLREMRMHRNFSIDEVSDTTKIRKDYINALENEDFSRLPPAVFVCGYVRKMCELYAIPDDTASDIIKSLKENSEYRLSEECMDNIIEQDDDINPDMEPRVKNIIWLVGGSVLFIAMVIIALTILSFSGGKKATTISPDSAATVAPAQFNPQDLNALSPKKRPAAAELSIPK
ncbi:MAG: helix-turn-helix domain-containing protein [Victivallaceae bacterium]|nr:helix-turn-helix domain-containing protein [Victivallaceae bacterium]